MIKLIVSDIDGTLTSHQSIISKENIDAIRYATNKGIKFVIASGRAYEDILPIFKEFPDIKFEVIAANGAQYYNQKGEVLESCFLNIETCKDICQLLTKHHLNYMIYTTKGVFTGCVVEDVRTAFVKRKLAIDGGDFSSIYQHFHKNYIPFRTMKAISLDTFFTSDVKILKVEAIDEGVSLINEVRPYISQYQGIAYLSSFPNNIEITNQQAQKGLLLTKVIKRLLIEKDEVMVIGDGANDITLFTHFNQSVAVKNAVPCIKELAKYHVSSNEESGVAEAIYLLCK